MLPKSVFVFTTMETVLEYHQLVDVFFFLKHPSLLHKFLPLELPFMANYLSLFRSSGYFASSAH